MSISLHSTSSLLVRIWRRWLAFLGATVGGIASEVVILVLTAAKDGGFQWRTWKNWRRTRRLCWRALRAVMVVWVTAFAINAFLTVRDDVSALETTCLQLESQNNTLRRKLNDLKAPPGTTNDKKSGAVAKSGVPASAKLRTLVRDARALSVDILSYKSEVDLNRPVQILSVSSPAITERTLTARDRYELAALSDFFPRFAGRIYATENAFRERGIDTSRLNTHLAHLINTEMLRLLSVDLNGMADQLEHLAEK